VWVVQEGLNGSFEGLAFHFRDDELPSIWQQIHL